MSGHLSPAPGLLLLATAELIDPNFAESVVLILDANDEGALGVIINRPSEVPMPEVLAQWSPLLTHPDVLFQGGPVSTDSALALATIGHDEAAPLGYRSVAGNLGIIDLDTPLELIADQLGSMRIYAGYAGWGAGQLEREIDEGSWYVVGSAPEDCFRDDSQHLWRDVLRRQPGDLAWHTTRPFDPELN